MSALEQKRKWLGDFTIRWHVLGAVMYDAWPVGLWLLGLALAGLVGWSLSTCASSAVRYAGTTLEIFGVLSVAHGLHRLRQKFEPTDERRRKDNWFVRLGHAFRRAEPTALQGSAASMAIVGSESSMRRAVGPGASLEDRLEVLEANFKQFEEETSRKFQIGTDKVSHLESELRVERNARIQTDDETLNQIKDMAIGGLHIELIGLIWVILGIIGASLPIECERPMSVPIQWI